MLQEMVGSEEVGYYSVAVRLIEIFAFLPVILNNSIFPALMSAKKESNELYKERFLNYYRLSFFLFLIIGLPLFLFSEKIVVFLYGIDYKPAGVLLSLVTVRLFFINAGVARNSFITIENLFKFKLITLIFGAVVNITLNYLLIPVYKSQGAILTTIVSFFITVFVIDYMYSKTRDNVKSQIIGIFTFYKFRLTIKK